MKSVFSRLTALLFLLLAAARSAVLHASRQPPPLAQTVPPIPPQSGRILTNQPTVSALSVPSQQVQVKTRVFSMEDLVQRVEDYSHQAWETANELKALIEKAKQGQSGRTQLTPEEELKVKQAVSFVREANTCLKYYIDHFVLTEEVLQKYERYIGGHPEEASSTNGVLKFMVHEFREIQLRKFEQGFFEKVKMYNSVIKDRFTPLLFLPISDRDVHALQIKLLNGERLVLFIKKYMAFVTRLRQGFRLLDYEKGNSLFRESDHDPNVNRLRVVSEKEFARVKRARGRARSHVPVTIVVGNEGYGTKQAESPKRPSDYIENKEEVAVSVATSNIHSTQVITEQQETQIPVSSSTLQGNEPNREVSFQGTTVSLAIPTQKKAQEPGVTEGLGLANKFRSPLELEKDAFIHQKMEDMERMFGHRDALHAAASQVSGASSGEHHTLVPDSQTQTLLPQDVSQPTLVPGKSDIVKEVVRSGKVLAGRVIETGNQNLVELDADGLPLNLRIHRVPEVIRMDERYQDPYVVAGKSQTGLTAKVAEVEGKRVGADYLAQSSTHLLTDEIPAKRVIYRPNEVNGGLPQSQKGGLADPDLSQIDEIIKDNGSLDKNKLRKMYSMLGVRQERSLWDEDFGAVYSRLRGQRLI